jgi:hypothetical protein
LPARSHEAAESRMMPADSTSGPATMSSRQGDLFRKDEQPDLFGEDAETPTWYPDPDEIRAELHKILAEARAATSMPWDERRVSLYRVIVPQMVTALPEDEGAQLRFAFEEELARLKAA